MRDIVVIVHAADLGPAVDLICERLRALPSEKVAPGDESGEPAVEWALCVADADDGFWDRDSRGRRRFVKFWWWGRYQVHSLLVPALAARVARRLNREDYFRPVFCGPRGGLGYYRPAEVST